MATSKLSDAEADDGADMREARRAMVEQVELHFADTASVTGVGGMSERVREALGRVPRHRFVLERTRHMAYADTALPIGCAQTISQPFIVALSIELARVGPDSRVLEIGTGSGYEAAVLAELTDEVYSIELIPELFESGGAALAETGYEAVSLRCGDGYLGWPEAAPFDAIIVTACAPEVPAPLLEQLAPGGRLVAPVGPQYGYQELEVHAKDAEGNVHVEHGLPVAFVPLVHADGGEAESEEVRAMKLGDRSGRDA